MIIDTCIIASDLNENYIGLYPYVREAWSKFNIRVILILVASYIPIDMIQYKEDIILFHPIPNIHSAFQAQIIRLLYPALLDNKNIIISDMDIIPLSRKYFVDNIKSYDSDSIIVFRNVYIERNMYSMCYIAVNTNIWKNVFHITNIDQITSYMQEWYDSNYTGQKNCSGWFTDQLMLYKYINNSNQKIIILDDKITQFSRIDKRNKKYILDNINKIYQEIIDEKHTDFHVIRPYIKYKHIIKKIVDLIK